MDLVSYAVASYSWRTALRLHDGLQSGEAPNDTTTQRDTA